MKKYIFIFVLITMTLIAFSQTDFEELQLESYITNVQPMTGLVYWEDSNNSNTDVISLEFSYMLFNDIVKDSGIYNWDLVERKLNAVAGRNHQTILRFRYVYPGYETSVPEYILNRDDYHETVGTSEGKETHFPDWTNAELKRFTLEFYTKFAERYDTDPRLAFIQVGFGLWAEYHIYDGPFVLGETFPSKEFQSSFFQHLDTTFTNIPWSISVDAADDTYSPFVEQPELKNIHFGVFDDSFMHQYHANWNEPNWNFFDRERFKISPAGGEFSYYSNYDQEHVLDYPDGPYGSSFETWASNFHITYMLANDQPRYQTNERIKTASMATGYKFKIVSIKTAVDTSIFELLNYGVAPIYYDAYIAVNGIRSNTSLKNLAPGETISCPVQANAKDAEITIECDKLVEGQTIQFYGTQELIIASTDEIEDLILGHIYPNPASVGNNVYLNGFSNKNVPIQFSLFDMQGKILDSRIIKNDEILIHTNNLSRGMHFIRLVQDNKIQTLKLMLL